MYKIKQIPEDFIVEEITSIKPQEQGKYFYFILSKTDYTTLKAIELISNKLKINTKNIGFAGNKDRIAKTKQLISICNTTKDRAKDLKLDNISLKFYGYSNHPISLGDLEGNKFTITVRNLNQKTIPKNQNIPNIFGQQRFSKQNHIIGKAILKKDFKKTVDLILDSEGEIEHRVKAYLEKNPTDYVGALNKINKKILLIYIHAFQSFIFNETVKIMLETGETKNQKIPVIGFGGDQNKITKELLKKEGVTSRDFIIRQIPNLSSEGYERELFLKPNKFTIINTEDDELNKGKFKTVLSFTLPKNSYATVVIDYLFKN